MQKSDNLIRDIFLQYIKYWPYFLISLLTCLCLCYLYLKYSTPGYKIVAKVLITDEKKGKIVTTPIYNDLGIVTSSNIDNEIEVLSSRSLMRLVIESLGYNIFYYKEVDGKKIEIREKELPFRVTIDKEYTPGEFTIEYDNSKKLIFIMNDTNKIIKDRQSFESALGKLTVVLNENIPFKEPVLVKVKDITKLPSVQVKPVNKTSSVVELSIVTTNAARGMDIINTLVDVYNEQTTENKNIVSINTLKFIDKRLDSITTDLYTAESRVESYKRNHKLTNIVNETDMALLSSSEYSKKITETDLQLSILESIKDYIENDKNTDNIVPFNIGVNDLTILRLMESYNDLLLKKNDIKRTVKIGNPQLIDIQGRIDLLKLNLLNSIINAENSLKLVKKELDKQEREFTQKLMDLPTQEKEYEIYSRQKNITEASYKYLIQKREETALTLAITIPNAQIIDTVYKNPTPVTPKRNMILLMATVLGILVPVIIIYILKTTDKKVRNKNEVYDTLTVPILGEIPFDKSKNFIAVKASNNSKIAHAFRMMAVDLYTMLRHHAKKTVIITSAAHNEGKTFTALNIAIALAETGKKIILIDADLRNSKLINMLNLKIDIGLETYLVNDQYKLSDIINDSGFNSNLDIISCKAHLPNPISILNGDRMKELLEELDIIYNYIIIDTPPIGIFADALILNEYSDYTLYLIRIDKTLKNNLSQCESLYLKNNINKMYCVLDN